MTTTMNTGAASLSDERERAAITACALMIKGICLTRPNAEWTGAIEDRIQFMLKQMQADAAIAAGGAQEPDVFEWLETELSAISCRYHGDPSYDHDAHWMKDRVMKLIADARKAFPLPRVAATVADGDAVFAALDRRAQSYISREAVEDVLIAVRALLAAASNGAPK